MDKVKLKFGWIELDVVVKTAVEDGKDKDTELKTVCTGKPGADPHPPVKVNGLMRCSNPKCEREERSYHPFPRGRDNGDGTFTIPNAEDLAAAVVDRSLVETIDLTASPVEDLEKHTLPIGRFYWLAPGKAVGKKYDAARKHLREHPETAYCAMYARSKAPAMYRVMAYGDLLGLQELAIPALLKDRPIVDVPEASEKDVAMMEMLTEDIQMPFEPDSFSDTRKAVIAAALAKADPEKAGDETALATVTPLVQPEADEFMAALRRAGKDPEAVVKRATRKKKVAEEAPPVQPLPSEVPANVDTTLAKPRKRAARKSA